MEARLGAHSQTIAGVYPIILRFEESAQHHKYPRRLIYARISGYLILEGQSGQTREVVSCAGDEEESAAYGKFYCDHFIHPCRLHHRNVSLYAILKEPIVKLHKSGTSASSASPSLSSFKFETREEMITHLFEEAP